LKLFFANAEFRIQGHATKYVVPNHSNPTRIYVPSLLEVLLFVGWAGVYKYKYTPWERTYKNRMDYKIFLVFYLREEKITFPHHVVPMKSELKKTYNIPPTLISPRQTPILLI
jgi:hypothetical protein